MIASAAGRLGGLDLARGLAVFGMVLVNFKFVMGLEGVDTGWLARLAGLFDGRAAATFVTLAGIGVSLLSKRAREARDAAALLSCRKLLLSRAAFLLAIGFLDTFLWIGDILHFYAVYLAVAALLIDDPDWRLWAWAAAVVAASVALYLFLDYEKGWDWELLAYEGLWKPRGALRHLFFNGFHPVFPWVSFLLVGMWLGRRDLASPAVQGRLVAAGVLAALAAEIVSPSLTAWAGSDGGEDAQWCALLFGTQSMPPTPLYMLSGGGSAAAVIGLCLALERRWPRSGWMDPVESTGRMALSLYAAHVVFGLAAIEWLELVEDQKMSFCVASAAVFYALSVLAAWAWERRLSRGPLEALMRRLAG